jgi:hypothetical protein
MFSSSEAIDSRVTSISVETPSILSAILSSLVPASSISRPALSMSLSASPFRSLYWMIFSSAAWILRLTSYRLFCRSVFFFSSSTSRSFSFSTFLSLSSRERSSLSVSFLLPASSVSAVRFSSRSPERLLRR